MRQARVATLATIEHPAAIVHVEERIVAGNPAGLAFFSKDNGMHLRAAVAEKLDAETPAGPVELTPANGHAVTAAYHPLEGWQAALVIVTNAPWQDASLPATAAFDQELVVTPTV